MRGFDDNYKLVRLVNGTASIHSVAERETFHPVIGPVAEAEALYVNQLKLRPRLAGHSGPFVVWDIGLGAAANVLTVLRAAREWNGVVRVSSFDRTTEPLRFALHHAAELGYLENWEPRLKILLENNRVVFTEGALTVEWELHPGEFPEVLRRGGGPFVPPAHAILFDAYSPAKNPEMWTASIFSGLFKLLDTHVPCALPTYSRSTMLRVTLLLAGFYAGVGKATGEKEETTIAANTLELLDAPLGRDWLERARRSKSAEPLWEPRYRQSPITAESWERLRSHPQFK